MKKELLSKRHGVAYRVLSLLLLLCLATAILPLGGGLTLQAAKAQPLYPAEGETATDIPDVLSGESPILPLSEETPLTGEALAGEALAGEALAVHADNPPAVAVGEMTAVTPSVTAADDPQTPIADAVITAESAQPQVASVEVIEGALNITANSAGIAEITITASKEGYTDATTEVAVTIEETAQRELHYNFFKGYTGDKSAAYPATLNHYRFTTKGGLGEINPAKASDPWMFFSYVKKAPADGNSYFKYNDSGYALAMSREGTAYLKIRVPVGGVYRAEALIFGLSSGPTAGELGIYRIQNGTAGEAVCTAQINASAFSGAQAVPISEGAFALEAGEYLFKVYANEYQKLFIVNGLKLIPDVLTPEFTLNVQEAAETTVGSGVTVPLSITAKNLPGYSLADVAIEAVAQDSNIVDVRVVRTSGGALLYLEGRNAGSTAVDLTARYDAFTRNATVNITVGEKPIVPARDLFYNFKKAWTGDTSYAYPASITYGMTEAGHSDEVNPDVASDPWMYFGTTAAGEGNSYFKYNSKDYGLALSYAGEGSLRIKVPAAGSYIPMAAIHGATNTPIKIAVYRYDAEHNAKGDVVVEKELDDISGTDDYEVSDTPIIFAEGEYVVSMSHTAPKGLAIIDGFKLVNIDRKLTVSAENITVVKGNQAKAAITVLDYQGAPVDAADLQYSVQTSDSSVATAAAAPAEGKLELTVQGVGIGACTVKVSVSTADGKAGEAVILITVKADFDLVIGMEIPDRISIDETASIPVSVKYAQGTVPGDDAPAQITVRSSSEDILAASVTEGAGQVDNTINLTPVATGSVALEVSIKVSEVVKTFKYAILVYNNKVMSENSYQYMIQNSVLAGRPLSEVSGYLKTIKDSGEQIRPGAVTDTWCYAGVSENATFKYYYDSYGSALEMDVGAWGAIRIRLPESGIYQAVSQNALYPMAGIMRVYLAPADAENPRDPKYSLGSKDTFTPGDKDTIIPVHLTQLGTVKLTAGDYIVSWEIIGKNPGLIMPAPRLYIGGFMLNPAAALPEITLKADAVPEIKKYSTAEVPLSVTASDGTDMDLYGAEIAVVPEDAGVASAKIVSRDNRTYLSVTGVDAGETKLDLSLRIRGEERATLSVPVKILPPGILTRVAVNIQGNETDNSIALRLLDPEKNKAQLAVHIYDEDDEEIPAESAVLQNVVYTFESSDESVATVDQTGLIEAFRQGSVTLSVTVVLSGVEKSGQLDITVTRGKTKSSYYTEARVSAARENAERYDWAKALRDAAVQSADIYVDKVDLLWEAVTTQELPRSYHVGYRNDPNVQTNRYTGENLSAEFGTYPWITDPINHPWKVICPKTGMMFPSNDFESFYKLGIDEHGNWSYELAKQKNAELVASGQEGYLVNKLYPEKGEGWGVDDGYGYDTGNVYPSGTKEVHTYISYYNHWGVWHGGLITKALTALRDAYIYTGDPKYGRVGAILVDRIADVYPDMDTAPYRAQLTATEDYAPKGKIVDLIWEHQLARNFTLSYDAFFPMYDDPYVVEYLSAKAAKYKMENPKTSGDLIRENIEDGILREIYRAVQTGNINGNFGMHQSCLAYAAVVLDTMPETKEWIDWVFRNGEAIGSPQAHTVTGGNVIRQLLTSVDRDGMTNEISPQYSDTWAGNTVALIDALAGYDKYPNMDMYSNPILIKMLSSMLPLTLARSATAQIGDSGSVADGKLYMNQARLVPAFLHTQNPIFAQMLYFLNGNKADGLHYDVYTKDPNRLASEVQQVVDQHGEYDFDRSEQIAGYGFSILRDGTYTPEKDTQRDIWMFYGRGAGHGHLDVLNLGMSAYGINIAPDLAYPIATTGDVYTNWGQNTIAHNTVVVDSSKQSRVRTHAADVMHFDDSGQVKIMDADAADRYPATDIYRRTVVMVNAGDDISYGIDFFRIKGGNEHLYSFHALSQEVAQTENLTLVPQKDADGAYIGSYAGAQIPYGTEGNTSGKTWLRNVDRASDVSGAYSVDFRIADTYGRIPSDMDLHLRLTMVNSFDLGEVAIAEGVPAQVPNNPEYVKFLLAKRTGTNLDSLFTTVLEPYDTQRYIESIEAVPVTLAGSDAVLGDADGVRAVKVTLKNGRVDYVFYAADNTKQYEVDGLFTFSGFTGVYSLVDGLPVYSYLNDGTELASQSAPDAYTGVVESFTTELTSENSVTVRFDGEVDLNNFVGRFIYIDNNAPGNAAFPIRSAVRNADGSVTLHTGDIHFISGIVDGGSADDYTYLIANGDSFRIPLPATFGPAVSFHPVAAQKGAVGRSLRFTVKADSPLGQSITYSAVSLPRGASLNPVTGEFIWMPDASQAGRHQAVIGASDGATSGTITVTIKISAPEDDEDEDDDEDENEDDDENKTADPGTAAPPVTPPLNPGTPSEPEISFTDLSGYEWAQADIYALARRGIIEGTSDTTFTPERSLKRAELAVLLVRAFGLTGTAQENFTDIPAGAYYAEALSAAKQNGIVEGIGSNRFNPEGSITREDLMLMIVRALNRLGIPLTEPGEDALAAFSDAGDVSAYALGAVRLLVGSGVIEGSGGKINPRGEATRAEAAVILNRILTKFVDQK